jgi:hypothetical protein
MRRVLYLILVWPFAAVVGFFMLCVALVLYPFDIIYDWRTKVLWRRWMEENFGEKGQ